MLQYWVNKVVWGRVDDFSWRMVQRQPETSLASEELVEPEVFAVESRVPVWRAFPPTLFFGLLLTLLIPYTGWLGGRFSFIYLLTMVCVVALIAIGLIEWLAAIVLRRTIEWSGDKCRLMHTVFSCRVVSDEICDHGLAVCLLDDFVIMSDFESGDVHRFALVIKRRSGEAEAAEGLIRVAVPSPSVEGRHLSIEDFSEACRVSKLDDCVLTKDGLLVDLIR